MLLDSRWKVNFWGDQTIVFALETSERRRRLSWLLKSGFEIGSGREEARKLKLGGSHRRHREEGMRPRKERIVSRHSKTE